MECENAGLVSGLITAGFGSGAAIFTPLQSFFLNPQALPPTLQPYADSPSEVYYADERVLGNVPLLLPRVSAVYFFMTLVAATLMAESFFGVAANVAAEEPAAPTASSARDAPHAFLSVQQVLKLPPFWRLWGAFALQGLPILFLAAFWRELLPRSPGSESALSVVAALASAFNAAGRILWGRLADERGFGPTLVRSSSFACRPQEWT